MKKIILLSTFISLFIISILFLITPVEAFEPGSCHSHPGEVCEYYSEWHTQEENYGNCNHKAPTELQ